MTLVERFIEFDRWSTSRKSALLYGLALPCHIGATLSARWLLGDMPWIDHALVSDLYWGWAVEVAVCFLISLGVALSGREGRWTLWLNLLPYGAFMLAAIAMFGIGSTALATWFPSVVVLVAVWYNPRAGLFAFVYGLSLMTLYLVLLDFDVVPYAPALLDRSIDVQSNVRWIAHIFLMSMSYFAFCLVLLVTLMLAKREQQARLDGAHQALDRSNRLISRYVPRQLISRIVAGGHADMLRPRRSKLTIVFSGLENFTAASDHLDPEDLAAVLNEYLSEMAAIAERHNATINQFVGDGIMILMGAPEFVSDRQHALDGVRMAMEMQGRMRELAEGWGQRGIDTPLRARIGINTGYVSVGDFGSDGRKVYSAIGVQASIALHLQSECTPGRILISQSTSALVADDIDCNDAGELRLPGLHFPVHVYEVADAGARPLADTAIAPPPRAVVTPISAAPRCG